MTIVHDSGIWISAIQFGGLPREAIRLTMEMHQLAISDFIVDEVYKNLHTKFGFTPGEIQEAMRQFTADALYVSITHEIQGACRDPKDDHVLECAKKAEADFIVSGDKDLLTLGAFEGIRVLTVRQYIEMARHAARR